MMIKTPSFWYRKPTEGPALFEKILTPLSKLYEKGAELHRESKSPSGVNCPVICVGNLNAGGSGKTPMALVLMQMAQESGLFKKPVFLTRGYGGRVRGPSLFDPKRHDPKDVGDEVFLLGKVAPCIIARDRFAGAMFAKNNNADLIIMDDGLQNYSLTQDLKIVVIDGSMGFGNGKTMPAGPLREPLSGGVAKADLFILMGNDQRGIGSLLPADKSVLNVSVTAQIDADDKDKPLFAFTGLGWPEKFFESLRAGGGDVVETQGFPDHHPYTPKEMDALIARAEAKGARLITTRKDMIRVPANYQRGGKISVAGLGMNWAEPQQVQEYMREQFTVLSGLYP